jgi:hypothetical protein
MAKQILYGEESRQVRSEIPVTSRRRKALRKRVSVTAGAQRGCCYPAPPSSSQAETGFRRTAIR